MAFWIKYSLWFRFPWVIMTPLGSDVEPDVYWRNATLLASNFDRIGTNLDEFGTAVVFPDSIIESVTIHLQRIRI